MPPTPNLVHLLQLAGLLGADAAWLLRGPSEESTFSWFDNDGVEHTFQIHEHALGTSFPAILVARFPKDDPAADRGLEELKLPPLADREIQVAALLSATLDALTRIGPQTTIRVIKWAFDRYGIRPDPWEARDRRPPVVMPPAPKPPEPPPAPATEATTRLETPDPRAERGAQLREQRLALGISQAALARRVGLEILPQARISLIERGKVDVDAALWAQIEAALEAIRKEREP